MSLGPTSTPLATLAGIWAYMEAQPASRVAARAAAGISFMKFSIGLRRQKKSASTSTLRHAALFHGQCIYFSVVSTMAHLHGALDLALAFAVLDGVALVVLGLALGQRNLALDLAGLPVQVQRYQGIALLLHLANQALDLFLVHQQ